MRSCFVLHPSPAPHVCFSLLSSLIVPLLFLVLVLLSLLGCRIKFHHQLFQLYQVALDFPPPSADAQNCTELFMECQGSISVSVVALALTSNMFWNKISQVHFRPYFLKYQPFKSQERKRGEEHVKSLRLRRCDLVLFCNRLSHLKCVFPPPSIVPVLFLVLVLLPLLACTINFRHQLLALDFFLSLY